MQYFYKLSFKNSWDQLIKKIEILRTSFVIASEIFSSAHQIVLKDVILPWREFNWKSGNRNGNQKIAIIIIF